MIYAIVAVDKNLGMGYKGKLPWHNQEELAFFKSVTINKTILMGLKTFLALGKILPDRKHIIATNNKNYKCDNLDVIITYDLIETIKNFKDKNEDLYIIGGSEIFTQSLKYIDILIISKLNSTYTCDVYFPYYENLFELKNQKKFKTFDVFYYTRIVE